MAMLMEGKIMITIEEAMKERHSVRQYDDRELPAEAVAALREKMEEVNRVGGLRIQLVVNEPKAFDGTMAHYGKFSGVRNYFALVGPKDKAEQCGYYGEQLVLLAQQLGLNTCWVALTFSKIKTAYTVGAGEKLHLVIALGYGLKQGVAHTSKPMEKLCSVPGEMPEWFKKGMEAAMLAPTAINQQKFLFTLGDSGVSSKAGMGMYTSIDLGIAKCHFELGAGKDSFKWV